MNKKKEIWAIFIGLVSLILLILMVVLCVVYKEFYYLVVTLIISWIVGVLLSFHIINSVRISDIKMCWVFVCLSLPLIGVVLFLLFGINPLRRKNIEEYLTRQKELNQHEDYLDTNTFFVENQNKELEQIVRYGYSVSRHPIYLDNNIKVIDPQPNFYTEALNLIRSAQESIYMQFYIYADSIFFKTIISEIVKRAQAGVKVYIIYDWVGIHHRVENKIWKKIMRLTDNIRVSVFNQWNFTIFTSKTNFRSHRKCIIVDNQKAIYGGSNIADEYLSFRPNTSLWTDLNCIVEGPIVNSLSLLFRLDWTYYCRELKLSADAPEQELAPIQPIHHLVRKKRSSDDEQQFSLVHAQLFESSPDYNEKTIRDLLLRIIGKARHRIWIVTPYFIVSEDIMNSLRSASLSGVDIRIVLPGEPDDKKYILTINRYSYKHLLGANISIYEYHGFCHSKLMIVDDELIVLGTFNFDFRSFYINFESALLLVSRGLNEYYERYFYRLMKNSEQINVNSFSKSVWRRIRWRMLWINIYYPLM